MPNRQYERGRALEYRVAKKLRGLGYVVFRSAGSHGVADLSVFPPGDVQHRPPWWIQCKGGAADMSKADREEFVQLAYRHGARPVLVVKGMRFLRLGANGYEEEFTPTKQGEPVG